MPADRDELSEAKEEGVHFRFLMAPVEIGGEDGVSSLKLEKMALGEPDEKGRRRVKGTGEYETVPTPCRGRTSTKPNFSSSTSPALITLRETPILIDSSRAGGSCSPTESSPERIMFSI